jgi:DNA-binding NarL/FixJ family response regulator
MSLTRTTLELVIENNQVVGIRTKNPESLHQPVVIDGKHKTVKFRMGVKTRRRAIELLSNAREGFTIKQIGGFLGLTEGSVHTLMSDLRRGGASIQAQGKASRRAYRIA